MTHTPRVGTRYRDNGGRGPLTAEVVAIEDGQRVPLAVMEYWNPANVRPRRKRFRLAVWYLAAPGCGWARVSPGT